MPRTFYTLDRLAEEQEKKQERMEEAKSKGNKPGVGTIQ